MKTIRGNNNNQCSCFSREINLRLSWIFLFIIVCIYVDRASSNNEISSASSRASWCFATHISHHRYNCCFTYPPLVTLYHWMKTYYARTAVLTRPTKRHFRAFTELLSRNKCFSPLYTLSHHRKPVYNLWKHVYWRHVDNCNGINNYSFCFISILSRDDESIDSIARRNKHKDSFVLSV